MGGLESYVRSMALRQQALGHDCTILTLNKVFHGDGRTLPAQETVEGLRVIRVGFAGMRRYFLPFAGPKLLRGYDIIHVHNTDVFFDYVALLSPWIKAKLVATTHGGFFHTRNFSLLKKIYFNSITRFSCTRYDTLFAISRNDYDTFKKLHGNIHLKPNAVEPLGDFTSAGADLLYLGRIAPHKHVEKIIKAHARLVKDHGLDRRLHIIGPLWDMTMEDLSSVVEAEGMQSHVVFHGCMRPEEVPAVARQCGYYLSASSFEGFGMAMIEAMSVGLIPFVHPNAAFEELIGLAGVGACISYDDPPAAAVAIAAQIETLEQSAPARAAAQNAARAFAAGYGWDNLVTDTLAHYQALLEAGA